MLKTTPLFSYLQGVSTRQDPTKGKKRALDGDEAEDEEEEEPTLAVYESPAKGELVRWEVKEGMVLDQLGDWYNKPVLHIKEPCTHSVQWHGQCAICGSDLTM